MVKYLDNNSGFNQWRATRDKDAKKSRFGGWLWWFIVFMAAWWLLTSWMGPKRQDGTTPVETPVEFAVTDNGVAPIEIESDAIRANVRGLRINDIALRGFKASAASDDDMVLLPGDSAFAELGYVATGTSAPTPNATWRAGENGTASYRAADGVEYVRNVSADGYIITVTDEIHNKTRNEIALAPYARIVRERSAAASGAVDTGAIAYVNSDLEYASWPKMDKKSYAYSTNAGFVGFADQYWETVVSIDGADQTMRVKKSGDKYVADVASGAHTIAPGANKTITTRIYAGPRDQGALNVASAQIAGINKTVDYGWFWFLARPLLWVLNGLNSIVGNYGVAIIILTILLRLAMWPLTRKSYVSMAAMQKMQPEMTRIQKLYANDKARMQMEMMRLYQTHKTSPMSGCLPMLIQIPIFFALYKALLVSVQMRSAHFLWISDLAAMDPYFILPVLMGASMWLQQYLQSPNRASAGANTNDAMAATTRMMKWMPLLFTVMFAWMPAGLVLYWTVSNLFGIMQMYIIKKRG